MLSFKDGAAADGDDRQGNRAGADDCIRFLVLKVGSQMVGNLETWSLIAGIVAVPVAVIGWFASGRRKTNQLTTNEGGTAISGDIRSGNAGIVAGHNSSVNVNVSVSNNGNATDNYARRYAVLLSTRAYLNELATGKLVSDETLRTVRRNADDAPLMFDNDLATYLREICNHATRVQSITNVMQKLDVGDAKARAARKAGEHRRWLLEQSDLLTERFRSVLQHG